VQTAVAAISIVLVVATEHVPAAAQAAGVTPRGPASSAAYASESTTTMTIGVPVGTQPGDVLIASLGFGSSVATSQPSLAAPPGWTLVTRVDTDVVGSLALFWHVFAAGETAYSWTASIKVGGIAFLTAYGGVDTTNPIDASAGQVTIKAVPIVAPSVTTTAANDLLVASYFGYRGNAGAVTWSPPSGMTELGDASNARSRSGCVDYAVQGPPAHPARRSQAPPVVRTTGSPSSQPCDRGPRPPTRRRPRSAGLEPAPCRIPARR